MKYTLISTALLLSFGVAQAGSGWDAEQEKDAANRESQSVQSTAVQPGIGDSASRFNNATYRASDLDLGDWTDLRNEEVYGSF